jgi:hypothetical protein
MLPPGVLRLPGKAAGRAIVITTNFEIRFVQCAFAHAVEGIDQDAQAFAVDIGNVYRIAVRQRLTGVSKDREQPPQSFFG